jgi:hypothetical protein
MTRTYDGLDRLTSETTPQGVALILDIASSRSNGLPQRAKC